MPFKKTIRSEFSSHTLFVSSCSRSDLPKNATEKDNYTTFYRVQNWDKDGVTFLFLGNGYTGPSGQEKPDSSQVVAWYPNGNFWSSYGKNLKAAIEGAQRDGWLSAVDRRSKVNDHEVFVVVDEEGKVFSTMDGQMHVYEHEQDAQPDEELAEGKKVKTATLIIEA